MTEHTHEHFVPDDTVVWAHIEKESPVNLTGVEKAVAHAIRHKHLLFIVYNSSLRLCEPVCVGYGDQGQSLVRAFQREGATETHGAWKLFRGDQIEGVWEVLVPFEVRPEFRSGDSSMSTILAELAL